MTNNPRRGDVWWVQLDPTRGSETGKTRRCIVMTNDIVNAHRRTIVVVPLSSGPHANPPLLIGVRAAGRPSVAVVDQIRSVSKERLGGQLGALTTREIEAVEAGLREVLDL